MDTYVVDEATQRGDAHLGSDWRSTIRLHSYQRKRTAISCHIVTQEGALCVPCRSSGTGSAADVVCMVISAAGGTSLMPPACRRTCHSLRRFFDRRERHLGPRREPSAHDMEDPRLDGAWRARSPWQFVADRSKRAAEQPSSVSLETSQSLPQRTHPEPHPAVTTGI